MDEIRNWKLDIGSKLQRPRLDAVRRCNSMNEKQVQDMPLSSKADAAFRQAAKKIIQRARQTGTPVVVWEQGHIKEIPGEEFEITMAAMELREPRP